MSGRLVELKSYRRVGLVPPGGEGCAKEGSVSSRARRLVRMPEVDRVSSVRHLNECIALHFSCLHFASILHTLSCRLDMAERATPLTEGDRRPKVGVGVFVLNEQNDFLMGKRKGSHGAGVQLFLSRHTPLTLSMTDRRRFDIYYTLTLHDLSQLHYYIDHNAIRYR